MTGEIPDYTRSDDSSSLEHITVRVDEEQLTEIDERVEDGEYPNRSVAIRDILDDAL
jgi:Arc/MetJ-type ribon-helix-helix transcriptional regulator